MIAVLAPSHDVAITIIHRDCVKVSHHIDETKDSDEAQTAPGTCPMFTRSRVCQMRALSDLHPSEEETVYMNVDIDI